MRVTRRHVEGVINICQTAIAAGQGKHLSRVDPTTSTVAAIIPEEAKANTQTTKSWSP